MYRTTFAAFVLFCVAGVASAQTAARTLPLNLAGDAAVQRVPTGLYDGIELRNAIPFAVYRLKIEQKDRDVTPIDLTAELKKASAETKKAAAGASGSRTLMNVPLSDVQVEACTQLQEATSALAEAKDETTVPSLKADVDALRASAACPNTYLVHLARLTSEATVHVVPSSHNMTEGRTVDVTVHRGEGSTAKQWNKQFDAGVAGNFRMNAALGGIPHRDHEFFLKPVQVTVGDATQTQYEITEETDRKNHDYFVGVLWTWFPAEETPLRGKKDIARLLTSFRTANVSGGWTFGGGVNFAASPTLLVGYSLVFRQNFGLAAGVAGHNQQRLRGEYKIGDKLKENVKPETLTEPTFSRNYFVVLTYRP